MQKIFNLLSDPAFWFATIFIGFLLSIAANFATESIKQVWGRFSARQRERNEEEKQRIEEVARKCVVDARYMTMTAASMIRLRVRTAEVRLAAFTLYLTGMLMYFYTMSMETASRLPLLDIDVVARSFSILFSSFMQGSNFYLLTYRSMYRILAIALMAVAAWGMFNSRHPYRKFEFLWAALNRSNDMLNEQLSVIPLDPEETK